MNLYPSLEKKGEGFLSIRLLVLVNHPLIKLKKDWSFLLGFFDEQMLVLLKNCLYDQQTNIVIGFMYFYFLRGEWTFQRPLSDLYQFIDNQNTAICYSLYILVFLSKVGLTLFQMFVFFNFLQLWQRAKLLQTNTQSQRKASLFYCNFNFIFFNWNFFRSFCFHCQLIFLPTSKIE